MKAKKACQLLTVALAVSFFLPSFAAKRPPKETLRIGMTQEFDNLNPLITNMLASFYLLKMVNRNFVIIDQDGQLVPQLIESIPSLSNQQARFIGKGDDKKLQATWKILPQAKWGDGTPVTCDDLSFTVKVALSGKIPTPSLSEYDNFEKIEALGENRKTCQITYKQAKWSFDRPGLYLLPKHIEEPIFEKYGNQPNGYENNSTYSKNPTNPGLFNGPYKITEVKLGSHIVVEPNPHFYGEAPKIRKIVLKLIPNTATLEANLVSGTIDMVSILGMQMDQALKFEKRVQKSQLPYEVNFKESLVYEHIRLNLADKVLQDLNVRQALVYAINRNDLTKVLFEGRQLPALHFASPQDPWFTDDDKKIKKYRYSLRRAKKLLEQSGWKVGEDGFRYKDGEQLQLTFMTTAGRKVRELVQQYLQAQWKKAGFNIQVKNYPPRVFFGEYLRKAKFQHLAMSANISEPESNPREQLHSARIPTKENNYSGLNRMRWKNSEVDRLIDAMELEFHSGKRAALAHQLLGHYTREVPVIPLFYRSDISVTPKGLQGYVMTGNNHPPTNFIEKWHF